MNKRLCCLQQTEHWRKVSILQKMKSFRHPTNERRRLEKLQWIAWNQKRMRMAAQLKSQKKSTRYPRQQQMERILPHQRDILSVIHIVVRRVQVRPDVLLCLPRNLLQEETTKNKGLHWELTWILTPRETVIKTLCRALLLNTCRRVPWLHRALIQSKRKCQWHRAMSRFPRLLFIRKETTARIQLWTAAQRRNSPTKVKGGSQTNPSTLKVAPRHQASAGYLIRTPLHGKKFPRMNFLLYRLKQPQPRPKVVLPRSEKRRRKLR
mmetsp:Transcript_3712/g.7805  ORF Transcript_3712/g.7805 Transcript_3712/m.7805 type:complete len:265 (-) Transcript_3712:1338-2132(-)